MFEYESPDGSLVIHDEQARRALASFRHSEAGRPVQVPPSVSERNHVAARQELRMARLAGHLGGSMELSEDETLELFKTNRHFRLFVAALLGASDLYDRRQEAALS